MCDGCRTQDPQPKRAPKLRCRCGAPLPSPLRRACDACKAATLERRRAHNRAWNRNHPDVGRAAQRRYAARHPDRVRALSRAWYHAVRADPVALVRYREDQRMRARLLAERLGRPLPPVPESDYPEASTQWTLPAGPLRTLVRDWLRDDDLDQSTLARAAGVSERLLYRLLHEEGEGVSVAAADRLLVTMGSHLDLVYEGAA